MQLDETIEQQLMSLDFSPLLIETGSSLVSGSNRSSGVQQGGFVPRRYNLRRNSDFPCSSSHASRSSEFLQVPMSVSQQRLANQNASSARIREARMDQLIFRLIDPQFSSIEPTINVTACEESSASRPNSLPMAEEEEEKSSAPPLLREVRSYSRSKTAPLVSSSSPGGLPSLPAKQCEARDLCGSSSNDEQKSNTSFV